MESLMAWVDVVRGDPVVGAGVAAAVIAVAVILNRKPRIQREADERLASIRRDKSDHYDKTRPLR